MNDKILNWITKNLLNLLLFHAMIAFSYFLICIFVGYLLNIFFNQYHIMLFGLGASLLLQHPISKYVNKINTKYKLIKLYQNKECNCKNCNCKNKK